MLSNWSLRAFRLWFVLYVPIAILFGYGVISTTIEIADGRREFANWNQIQQEKVARGERAPVTLDEVKRAMLYEDFDRPYLYERRNYALSILSCGFLVPAIVMLLIKVIGWIWIKERHLNESLSSPIKAESNLLKRYIRWYCWSWVIAVVAVVTLLFTREKTIQTLVASLVQGLILLVAAWLILRIKEWWAWQKSDKKIE